MSKASELVDRLRNGKNKPDNNLRWHVTDIHLEAADLIESQQKTIEEMRALLNRFVDSAWANDGMPHEAVVSMQIVRDAEDYLASIDKGETE